MAIDAKDHDTLSLLPNRVGRPRKHKDNAAKQKAYRARLKQKKRPKEQQDPKS
ncbi:hypothetical protein [Neptuniibacter halophilus]|uniref:hypothetical protein n=1 Tax=Neptuniibacter halophilus TaxID=651666 RepID=UPI00257317B5|nr:hypothetical protein [Neptuniibacter halophilus]